MTSRFEKVRELVLGAQEVPIDERSAWLQSACGDDEDLRAEVQSLLEHDQSDESLLHTGGAIPSNMTLPVATHREFGPYELLDVLGRGPTGTVFRSRHRDSPHDEVALKVLNQDTDGAAVLHRFREARDAVLALSHPSIAAVLGTITSEAGELAFVSEFVRGPRITEHARATTLTIRDRVTLVSQVADALQHIHQRGIVHGHVKPNNVMVTRRQGTAKVLLVDVGIAAAAHTAPPDRSPTTHADAVALGNILFELLTGRPVPTDGLDSAFRPSSQLEGPDLEQRARHRRTNVKQWRRALTGDLDEIVTRSIRPNAAERQSSMDDLAEGLQRYLARNPVTPRRLWRD